MSISAMLVFGLLVATPVGAGELDLTAQFDFAAPNISSMQEWLLPRIPPALDSKKVALAAGDGTLNTSLDCNKGYISDPSCAEELIQNLPEILALAKQISQHDGVTPIIFTEAEPEPNAKAGTEAAAYRIYFGEDHQTHTVRVLTFAVDAKTRAIFVYDDLQSERIPLAEWRKRKKQSP